MLALLTFVLSAALAPVALASGNGNQDELDLQNSDNLVGWWGSGSYDYEYELPQVCAVSAYSVVILSFLYTNHGFHGWPAMAFNVENTNASQAQIDVGATGLMWMPEMAKQIKTCQEAGKKVMLSIGGGTGNVTFANDAEAVAFAHQVWQLFGGDTQTLRAIRPYGDVVLDGFDLDNETHNVTGYTALTYTLRALMDRDLSKQYYISSAPQCPQPRNNPNLPLEAMQAMDFVNVQFYNNGNCNHGQPGFLDSVKAWSEALSGNQSNAKLFIAGLGDHRGGTGYIPPKEMVAEIVQVDELKEKYWLDNIGGYSLWDLADALDHGFPTPIKEALVNDLG